MADMMNDETFEHILSGLISDSTYNVEMNLDFIEATICIVI